MKAIDSLQTLYLDQMEKWMEKKKEREGLRDDGSMDQEIQRGILNIQIELMQEQMDMTLRAISGTEDNGKAHKAELIKDTKYIKRMRCNTCGIEYTIYRIYFSQIHIKILYKILRHCIDNQTHIIKKNDISGLTHTDYGNFFALQRFGFLYHLEGEKDIRGNWGVAVGRICDFLQDKWAVAEYSEKNTATKEQKVSDRRITISQIPKYKAFVDDTSLYLPYFIKYGEEVAEASDAYGGFNFNK